VPKNGGNFQQKVGSTYKVMANGANEWTERTAGQGQKDNTSGWGCMEFDSAFTGWVCLPWDSLYGELDNGDPQELNISRTQSCPGLRYRPEIRRQHRYREFDLWSDVYHGQS